MSTKLKKYLNENKSVLLCLMVAAALTFLWSITKKAPTAGPLKEVAPEVASTFIPKGMVLVPVRLENAQSISTLLGEMGVIDLFATTPSGETKKVVSRVKVLRSPNNPTEYAVLCHQSRAKEILKWGGPFIAAIQNPNVENTQFEAVQPKLRVRVDYPPESPRL